MAPKPIEQWDVDEVSIWLNSIGLGEKVDPFRENSVDGDLLLTLTDEDLKGDLGLTNLQAKKVKRSIEFTKSLESQEASSGSGGGDDELAAKVEQLELEAKELRERLVEKDEKIRDLEMEIQKSQPAPEPEPEPEPERAPAPAPAPAPSRREPGVVGHAARGAAGGAVKGAIVGAILPGMEAGDGAAAGAAAGAAGGALRGIGARRGRRFR